MMHRILFAALTCLVMSLAVASNAVAKNDQPTIAVLETQIGQDAERVARYAQLPDNLHRSIETAIRGSRRFTVLERAPDNLSAILNEQELASSSYSHSANAPSGGLESAGYVVLPVITEFILGADFTPLDAFPGRYSRRDYAAISAEVRVLDSETGALVYSREARESYSHRTDVVEGRTGGPGRAVVSRLVERLGPQLGASVINHVFPIMIAQVQDREVFLNRGEGGVQTGDVFEVYNQGEALIDPITGEALGGFGGRAESLTGRIRITRIAPRFSVAEILEGNPADFETGAIARPLSR